MIKRGVEVEVPESVKEVLDNSAAQEERAAEYMETQQKEYEQKTKNWKHDCTGHLIMDALFSKRG